MGKGYSVSCVIRHRRVRELYKKRHAQLKKTEFGDLTPYLSSQYYFDYIRGETKYCITSIKSILSRKQKEIDKRECIMVGLNKKEITE